MLIGQVDSYYRDLPQCFVSFPPQPVEVYTVNFTFYADLCFQEAIMPAKSSHGKGLVMK